MSGGQPLQQEVDSDPQELKEIKKNYMVELETATKPVRSLYLAKLEVLKQQLALSGALKAALAVEEEMEKIKKVEQILPQDSITTTKREDSIFGKWTWFNGDVHVFLPQGKIAGDSNSNWLLLDKDKKLYRIIWGGKWIDTVNISLDGRTLTGTNQNGIRITGTKIQ